MNKPALLVVDDDPQVLAAVRRDLRSRYREPYVIISASSGEEALATIRELKARGDALALVISDQRMPGISGSTFLVRASELVADPMIALVIEDERDERDTLCGVLESAGWTVEVAEDGIAGLGRVPVARPDIILLDLRMPGVGGMEALRRIR